MIYYSRKFHDTNTLCPSCKVEMTVGQAIRTGISDESVCTGFGRPLINNETLKLIECLKFPSCGHSDDLN